MAERPLIDVLPTYTGPNPSAPLQQAQPGDAGTDVYATQDAVIQPGGRILMPTGLRVALPVLQVTDTSIFFEEGLVLDVRPKSGLALNFGLTLLNTPGTIDSGYRGEIAVILYNSNPIVDTHVVDTLLQVLDGGATASDLRKKVEEARETSVISIRRGQKIAQVVCIRYVIPKYRCVDAGEVLPDTLRGVGGFGSTGIGGEQVTLEA